MRKTLLSMAATAALASSPAAANSSAGMQGEAEKTDVAYHALASGRTADALIQLRDSKAVRNSDPAALINLGAAYARQGRLNEARTLFTAAINSPTRYSLELADGSWIDSRKAAKLALERLDQQQPGIALR